jgi:hypothetical protein
LQKGQRTQARRVSSIPQLKCVGGSAKGVYEPDVVQCYNRGSDGVDVQVRWIYFWFLKIIRICFSGNVQVKCLKNLNLEK